jgi:hypothetical protein
MGWRLARMNPRLSTCKRSHNEPSVGRPRPCGGALGLLEQLDRIWEGNVEVAGRGHPPAVQVPPAPCRAKPI